MFDEYFAMRSTWWALLVVVGACTKPNPASCLDGFCSDPTLPFCDVDGSIGGVPDTCIAVECTPNEFESCRDEDHALVCSGDGTTFELKECEFGCGDDGCLPCNTAECQPLEKHIIPRYLSTVCDDVETTQLAVTSDLAINTSDAASCAFVVTQAAGPEICVIHHEAIVVDPNRTIRVTGTRAIALVADRKFEMNGIVDASANGSTNGPGGGIIKSGGGGNLVSGGGSGNRTIGGHGGNADTDGGALNGGAAQMNQSQLIELFGGPQANKATGSSSPGGSGGAATLICCRCELSVSGTIDVNGAGGGGGTSNGNGTFGPPGGGGAGGSIVLQGMRITVNGEVFSNGGGGGAGGNTLNVSTTGEKGRRATSCASGAVGQPGAGSGGFGACGLVAPGVGLAATNNRAGGGGGSTGFLLTYTPTGVTPALNPSVVSPPFEPNGVIPTN